MPETPEREASAQPRTGQGYGGRYGVRGINRGKHRSRLDVRASSLEEPALHAGEHGDGEPLENESNRNPDPVEVTEKTERLRQCSPSPHYERANNCDAYEPDGCWSPESPALSLRPSVRYLRKIAGFSCREGKARIWGNGLRFIGLGNHCPRAAHHPNRHRCSATSRRSIRSRRRAPMFRLQKAVMSIRTHNHGGYVPTDHRRQTAQADPQRNPQAGVTQLAIPEQIFARTLTNSPRRTDAEKADRWRHRSVLAGRAQAQGRSALRSGSGDDRLTREFRLL